MLDVLTVFLAGIITLTTPCVLPLIPVYLAMMLGGAADSMTASSNRRHLLYMALAFSFGFAVVFTLLGLSASLLGTLLNQNREILSVVASLLIFAFGLKFLGFINIGFLERDVRFNGPARVSGFAGAFGFGFVFALGWTPCVGPVLGSVLSYAVLSGSEVKGALLLLVYSSGIALPLIVVAGFADRTIPLLRKLSRHLLKLQRVTGVVMVAVALFIGINAAIDLASKHTDDSPVAVTTQGMILSPLLGQPIEKPRLVELVEEDCAICQRMASRIEALEQDCSDHLVDVHVVSLSDSKNSDLKGKLNLRGVPTILLIDDTGNLVETLVGERSLSELRGIAANLQATQCAGEDPFFEFDRLPETPKCDSNETLGSMECG